MKKEVVILRELAKKVVEISAADIQEEKRELWRKHNNLEHVRPPIYVRESRWMDEVITPQLQCENKFYRDHEFFLRHMIFQDTIGDDYVIEPWITQKASYILPKNGHWGLKINKEHSSVEGGGFHIDSPIKKLEDSKGMIIPIHKINEEETTKNVTKLNEAVGDIMEVNVDRGPFWRTWTGDISTDLGYLRGMEQVMWDIYDNPKWLHSILGFMRDGILKAQEEAEKEGDWQLCNHENQSMPYMKGMKDRKANSGAVGRKELWGFVSAQEMVQVSPEHHDEFMLQYQIPIMEKFGATAYGCCEDLTKKIDMLRKISNLRRIAVSPFADIESCAEQIGTDYVCSWRPSPSMTVCNGFDKENVYKIISEGMEKFRKYNCIADICLKDVRTIQHDRDRLQRFVEIVRSVVGK